MKKYSSSELLHIYSLSLWLLAGFLTMIATILILYGAILFAGVYGFILQDDLNLVISKSTTRPTLFFLAGITLVAIVVLLFKAEKKLQIKKDEESREKWRSKFKNEGD